MFREASSMFFVEGGRWKVKGERQVYTHVMCSSMLITASL